MSTASGHAYANDATQIMAVSLANERDIAEQMQRIGPDLVKAREILMSAARREARRNGLDLAEVDWSEVVAEFFPDGWAPPAQGVGAPGADGPSLTLLEGGGGREIRPDVLEILGECTAEANLVRLPPRRLDPKLYGRVNEVLMALGGRWKGGKVQAHVFGEDAAPILEVAVATGRFLRPQDFGYFPTPDALVDQLIELARLEPGMRVLEPQAGSGSIALAAARIVGASNVTCVELLPKNAACLRQQGLPNVHVQDFLKLQPADLGGFDRVIMNPPFSRLADVEHVMHATSFLKPDGELVAITSPSWEFHGSRKAGEFRDFFEQCEGASREVPAGAFRAAGTDVATRVLHLRAENFPWNRRETVRERQRA